MRPLMVQGTNSSAGKTVLVAALCRIFSDMGYDVAPFKSQNMSNFVYAGSNFEISRAQAVQAVAARCKITPDLNPVLLKPLGDYQSMVYLCGKRYKKMHAEDYYAKFAMSKGLRAATDSLSRLKKDHDLVILEGAGSPAEINLQKYDIANMRIASRAKASVLLVSDIDRGGAFASLVGTMELIEKKYQRLVRGFILNRFRGDTGVLEPGLAKLRRITGISVLGTVPMIPLDLPEEDSFGAGPGRFAWTKSGVSKIDREIDVLADVVRNSLDIKSIEAMTK